MKPFSKYLETGGWIYDDDLDEEAGLCSSPAPPRELVIDLSAVRAFWTEAHGITAVELDTGSVYLLDVAFPDFRTLMRSWRANNDWLQGRN